MVENRLGGLGKLKGSRCDWNRGKGKGGRLKTEEKPGLEGPVAHSQEIRFLFYRNWE